jgi:hypothetical protein
MGSWNGIPFQLPKEDFFNRGVFHTHPPTYLAVEQPVPSHKTFLIRPKFLKMPPGDVIHCTCTHVHVRNMLYSLVSMVMMVVVVMMMMVVPMVMVVVVVSMVTVDPFLHYRGDESLGNLGTPLLGCLVSLIFFLYVLLLLLTATAAAAGGAGVDAARTVL